VLHILLTIVLVLFILAAVGLGASIRGPSFRLYSLLTVSILVSFGVLTSLVAPSPDSAEPTPWLGFLERILIGAFLLWVAVLAVSLWPIPTGKQVRPRKSPGRGTSLRTLPAE
jgi:hypothetical protein